MRPGQARVTPSSVPRFSGTWTRKASCCPCCTSMSREMCRGGWRRRPAGLSADRRCPQTREQPFYRCFAETKGWPDLTWLEREMAAGRIGVLGEMLFVYTGVDPNNSKMAPYWALAAKYDVPVAVHINRGPGPASGLRRRCSVPSSRATGASESCWRMSARAVLTSCPSTPRLRRC